MAETTSKRVATTDWRLRPLRPSDALVWVLGQAREMTAGGLEFLGISAGLALVAWFFVLPSVPVAAFLVVASMVAGAVLAYQVHQEGALGWLTTRRAVAGVAMASNSGWLLLFLTPSPRWASITGLVWWELFSRRPGKRSEKEPWWVHWRISTAFVTAGVLQMVKVQGVPDSLPTIGYIGKGREDETGHWRTFRLPAGSTWEQVRTKHVAMASAIGVPSNLLHIEHDEDQPANAVTLAVLNKRDPKPVPAVLPARTSFWEPVPLGVDRLGRPQVLQTTQTHSAFIGKTRSGKTRLARYFVAWGLLDPKVAVWMVSGKDDPEDWQGLKDHGLAIRYATVSDLQGVLDLLREVERVGEYRGTLKKADRYPALLIVDEWYRLRSKAEVEDPKLAAELVKLISALAATLASRNVHMVMTFQRGTVTFIDADLRASLGQKAVGMVAKENETRIVLDMVPLVTPKRQGEFLFTIDDSEPTLVPVPDLGDEAFLEVCARAAKLRADEPLAPVLPELALVPDEDTAARVWQAEETAEAEQDPLTLEVWEVLHRHGALQASVVWEKLPEEVQPAGANVLGKRMAKMPGVRERWVGSTKLWELVPRYPGTPGYPRGMATTGGFYPRAVPQEALTDAGEAARDDLLPDLQVVP